LESHHCAIQIIELDNDETTEEEEQFYNHLNQILRYRVVDSDDVEQQQLKTTSSIDSSSFSPNHHARMGNLELLGIPGIDSSSLSGIDPSGDLGVLLSVPETVAAITVAVYPDGHPQDMGFILSKATTAATDSNNNNLDDGDSSSRSNTIIAERPCGYFENLDSLYTESIIITVGETYNFTCLDGYGDGLKEPGFFGVYYGERASPEEEIVRVSARDFSESSSRLSTLFVAQRPDTPAPSVSSAPSVSPAPTHAPTSCLSSEEEASRVVDDTRDYTPHWYTTTTTTTSDDYCQAHGTYQSCTGEVRQDCQWQFTSASLRGGVCRVDPVAACIRNGNCQCDTIDFKGGSAELADGLLVHIPLTVTAQDIVQKYPNNIQPIETIIVTEEKKPDTKEQQPFFVSRVDFSRRIITYHFLDHDDSLEFSESINPTFTVAFKLHHLFWNTPMDGVIWNGIGLMVSIGPDHGTMTINGVEYNTTTTPLKLWTCSSIVITNTSLYIGREEIQRDLSLETTPPTTTTTPPPPYYNNNSSSENTTQTSSSIIQLGPFSGELFDVRVYRGTLSFREIRTVGARCTYDDVGAALEYKRDIVNPYYTYGCEPDFGRLPADEGGPVPTSGGPLTYGSGPFATLWLRPKRNAFNSSELLDAGTDDDSGFDEEHFFQQARIQSYLWEKFLFDVDMIGFNQEPYRYFDSPDQVPKFSATFWNNPCRWLHNFNNGWQFPIYRDILPKWTAEKHGSSSSIAVAKADPAAADDPDPDEITTEQQPSNFFDLSTMYNSRSTWAGEQISYFAHELFHGVQGHLIQMYAGRGSRWLAESTAEFAADFAFPAADKILAALTVAPAYPLGMIVYRDRDRGAHFVTPELSLNDAVRGGHMYASWVLWWFLAEHAGLPHLAGQVYSNWHRTSAYTAGELFLLRQLVENADLDFGDVWSTCIAHLRTWDFPVFGDSYRTAEATNFESVVVVVVSEDSNIQPPVPPDTTLEGRKTAAEINPIEGTNGEWIAGPDELRPGPNGWNCLTIRDVAPSQLISIDIEWNDGMGFASANQYPEYLPLQQRGCDDDPRFFNSVVVAHNEVTGVRRYWKLKGKKPSQLNILSSDDDDDLVTIHVILVPTPPADYVLGHIPLERGSTNKNKVDPIPAYGYQYKVEICDAIDADANNTTTNITPEAEKEHGLMKLAPATPGWWPVECTCLEDPTTPSNRCVRPTFDGVGNNNNNGVPPVISIDTIETNNNNNNNASSQVEACFSGESSVQVRTTNSRNNNGGVGTTTTTVLMNDLQLGDEVLTHDGTFQKVYSFAHRHESLRTEYLQIFTTVSPSEKPLQITANHLVFTADGKAVSASEIRVGDELKAITTTANNNILLHVPEVTTVISIGYTYQNGLYAPFTMSGTIVVDQIVASSYAYASFDRHHSNRYYYLFNNNNNYHWIAHLMQFPHRTFCRTMSSCWCRKESYDEDGFSRWARILYDGYSWLEAQNTLLVLTTCGVVLFVVPFLVVCGVVVKLLFRGRIHFRK